ncbi:ABC transporter ATP-binding protein [bacterium]|nr:ABC transporter ATP-binding protein [bacterium]
MPQAAICIKNLTKVFSGDLGKKPVKAVDALSLDVVPGEVFAFLGANGAGKTTTIKCMMRLLFATRGTVGLFGISNQSPDAMKSVGFMPEQPQFYGYLTGREFLYFIARLYKMKKNEQKIRIETCLDRVGLTGRADQRIKGYSRGMMQRLGLAQALIDDPKLLILDEPMSNLDPIGRKEFRDLILSLKEQGKTLFFSSHILSDAEIIADRVGILNHGKLINTGKLKDLIQSQTTSIDVTFVLAQEKLKKLNLDQSQIVRQDEKNLVQLQSEKEVQTLIENIIRLKGNVVSVIPQKRNLEDIFMTEIGG